MSIDLTPEHQKLIDVAIRSGAYSDAGQVIGRALEILSAEDEWLRAQRNTGTPFFMRRTADGDSAPAKPPC